MIIEWDSYSTLNCLEDFIRDNYFSELGVFFFIMITNLFCDIL